jgi:hypothetical protein
LGDFSPILLVEYFKKWSFTSTHSGASIKIHVQFFIDGAQRVGISKDKKFLM